MNFERVTRLEVVDTRRPYEQGGGRVYTLFDAEAHIVASLQDDGRTLKLFIEERNPKIPRVPSNSSK